MLKTTARWFAASLAVVLVGACSTGPKGQTDLTSSQVGSCTSQSIEALNRASDLRQRAADCKQYVEAYASALNRLNQLQPETRDRILLQPVTPLAEAEKVAFETEVFFEFLEAYPPDIVFDKLADLVRRANQGFAISHVQIIAGADRDERELKSFDVANRRAAMLKRYFVGSGVPADKVFATERQPSHPQTPEGRARDRGAEIMVVIVRKRAPSQ